ncbi:DNA-damage-repair/toleration protein DRT102 [Pyrus ussuriensis x Pyrus communis]|uniref:DNA-damage-repair/toleration protein DRT102 n=1 Tax=Pyrus ussuriensis x Pyrus communis TaxID=2448454 RepID=A0A5N5I1Z2_9ROSA|nr:DNA-damage-repair/toleration protein DRT102 [Pyrus ussuriensis x Pyrus communis]
MRDSFDCFLKDALVSQLSRVFLSSSNSLKTCDLIAYGTGVGVNSHFINISNVLVDSAKIDSFRENSIQGMPKIRDKIRANKILGIRVGCRLIWGDKREGR